MMPSSATARATPGRGVDLRTSHLLPELGRQAARGAAAAAAGQSIRFAVNFGAMLVLARLLTPEDFGLVAMVTAVTGFFEMFKDAGLSTATIQRAEITAAQVSNLFWANIAIGTAAAVLLSAAAPLVALCYGEPRAAPVTIALSATFLLTAASVQHQAILRRQMRFRALAAIQTIAAAGGALAAIVLALRGAGWWALVASSIAAAGLSCALAWGLCRWVPALPARQTGTRAMLSFGAHLTGASLVQTVVGTADSLLVGRRFGADMLGLYSRGAALITSPVQQFLSPFHSVFVPALSRLQHDPARFRLAFLRVMRLLALAALPAAGLVVAAADPIVVTLLGAPWRGAGPVVAAFALMGVYAPLAGASTWLFTSQGRGRELLTSSVIVAALSLAAIAAGLPFGPAGVAVSLAACGLGLRLPVLFYFAGRRGPVSTADLWRPLLQAAPLGLVSFAAAAAAVRILAHAAPLVQTAGAAAAAAALTAAVIWISAAHRRTASDAVQQLSRAFLRAAEPAAHSPETQ